MAIFTIAKSREGVIEQINDFNEVIKEKVYVEVKYKTENDLRNLLNYCYRSCICMEMNNLYEGSFEMLVLQMLYLQRCKGEELNTRAVHYIMSFYRVEFGYTEEEQNRNVRTAMGVIQSHMPENYQCIMFLHDDKKDRFDIHMVINPVGVKDLKIYHCSPDNFRERIEEIGLSLFLLYRITVYNYTYEKEYSGKYYFAKGDNECKNLYDSKH